ncbi:MAG: YfiR family protein [Acidobacteria bacterium]|nr:YfiR family protein [Acidobacteriota bacterium]
MLRTVVALTLVLLLVAWIAPVVGSAYVSGPEDEVMSALILGFVRYAEWPPGASPTDPSASIAVCANGRPSLVRALTRTFAGKSISGRQLVAREVKTAAEAALCQVLFVSSDNQRQLTELLGAVQQIPVLTIGDSEAIFAAGGIVQFFEEDGKMRFAVHLDALARSRVSVSARLLRLGQVVKGKLR